MREKNRRKNFHYHQTTANQTKHATPTIVSPPNALDEMLIGRYKLAFYIDLLIFKYFKLLKIP